MISNDLSQAIQRHWHTAVALSDDLYAHPEIAHQEFRSSQKVVELLRQAGYQVEYPYMATPPPSRGVLKMGKVPPPPSWWNTTPFPVWATPAATTCRDRPFWAQQGTERCSHRRTVYHHGLRHACRREHQRQGRDAGKRLYL